MKVPRYLFIPFVIFFLAFVVDKLFLLESVHTYFSKTLSDINYIQKNDLYNSLKDYLKRPDRKKVFVYFGNSRALLFSPKYIEEAYPGWTLYNFSVPGGRPDYALQWAEKFQKDQLRPDFVLLDHSIELYNATAKLKVDETLTNGLEVSFVLRHWDMFSLDEISTLLAKRMFRTYQYRPKLEVIFKRAKQKDLYLYPYQKMRREFFQQLEVGQGSAVTPGTHESVMPEAFLKKSSFGDFHSYMVPFQFNERTFSFFQKTSEIFQELGVPQAAIMVRLSLPYMDLIRNQKNMVGLEKEKLSSYSFWLPLVQSYHEKNKIPFWNMNEDQNYTCDSFSDAGHMAPKCYRDYTDFIMTRVVKSAK